MTIRGETVPQTEESKFMDPEVGAGWCEPRPNHRKATGNEEAARGSISRGPVDHRWGLDSLMGSKYSFRGFLLKLE